MGLGLYALAGALEGAGKGWTMVEQEKLLEKRNAYLHDQRLETQSEQARLQDENNAAQNQRQHDTRMIEKGSDQKFQISMANAGAAAKSADKQSERDWELEKLKITQAFERDQNAKDRQADITKQFGKPISAYTNEVTGDVTEIYRTADGGTKKVVYKGIAKEAGSGGIAPLTPGKSPLKPSAQGVDYVFDPETGEMKQAGR